MKISQLYPKIICDNQVDAAETGSGSEMSG